MQNLTDIAYMKSVLSRHGFTFSKALGQNFLVNPTVCPKTANKILYLFFVMTYKSILYIKY